MKKVLFLLVAVALFAWVISWFRAEDAVIASAARPWPAELGTLDSALDRYPPHAGNDASDRLAVIGNALPRSEALDEYVRNEIARGELTIGPPPALPDTSAIARLLLSEPVIWQRYSGFDHPDVGTRRAMQMTMARALVASALVKARANDPAAWDDLHAVWKLARTLDPHPQMMVQVAALTMGRMINAVAWKLPLPAPAWLDELQERDQVGPLIEAFHYQVASYGASGSQLFPTKVLANSVDRDRAIAEELLKVTTCVVNPRPNELGTDLSGVWRRAFRFRAEREATANALRVREGKPIETKSVCSDGTWSYADDTLRFSREIPPGTSEKPMPLVLRVRPQRD